MRDLTFEELGAVSGGDFLVDGVGGTGFSGFNGGFSSWYDANVMVDPVTVTAPLNMSQIAEANAYANAVAQWGIWGADLGLSILSQAPGLGWAATAVGAAITTPPVANQVTQTLSDAIFSAISRAGGLKNYMYLQTFAPSL